MEKNNLPAAARGHRTQASAECRSIELTNGMFAIVDAGDYEWLRELSWYAKKEGRTDAQYYACHTQHNPRKTVRMHRLIMGEPSAIVDHKDLNTLNNQRSNLRVATPSQSTCNRSVQKNNRTGIKGVSPRHGKWIASITVGGQKINLGKFDTPESAGDAYRKAADVYHGEFAHA